VLAKTSSNLTDRSTDSYSQKGGPDDPGLGSREIWSHGAVGSRQPARTEAAEYGSLVNCIVTVTVTK
jgi:hypothetical protein